MNTPAETPRIHTWTAEFEPLWVADHAAVAHLVVQIEAAKAPEGQPRPPLRLAIAIDCSGSMNGRPLQLASRAAQQALKLLREQDEFCVVTFASDAQLLVPAGPASRERVAEALQRCNLLIAHGNTHLSAGWLMGCNALLATPLPAGATALCLLLSDGHANSGETNREVLADWARAKRVSGVATTAVGLGEGVDEALLDGMARSGEGRFFFASDPGQLEGIFAGEVGDALQVVAPAVTLCVEARNPAAEAAIWQPVSAFAVKNQAQPFTLALGDLTSEQVLTAVIEVQLPAGLSGERLEFSAHLCDASGEELVHAVALELRRAAPAEVLTQPRDPARWRSAAEQRVHRVRMLALRLNGEHLRQEAAQVLRSEAEVLRLLAGPLAAVTRDLEEQLEREAVQVSAIMDEMLRKEAYTAAAYSSRSRSKDGHTVKSMDFEASLLAELKGRR